MNEFEKNNASELLTQLLDGELESANEPVLFSAMATDKDLFDELKQHLAIREAIRKDTEAFTPPPETVNAVFASLGYRAPGVAPLPAAIIPKTAVWGKYLRRAVPFALLLIGLVGSYSVFKSSTETDSPNSKFLKPDSKIEVASLNTVKAELPVVVSSEKHSIYKSAVVIKKTTNRKQVNSTEMPDESVLQNNSETAAIDLPKASVNETKPNINIEQVSLLKSKNNYFQDIQTTSSMNNYPSINKGVTVAPLKLGSSNDLKLYIKNNNISASEPFFMNMLIGINFISAGNSKIGFEGGRQKYNVKVTDKNDVIYEDSRNVIWGAVSYRYEIQELSINDITPYAQISFGFNDFGKYLARGSAGIEIIPFGNNLGINLGYDYSQLWYSTLGNPYSTNTLGFSFGLSWKF